MGLARPEFLDTGFVDPAGAAISPPARGDVGSKRGLIQVTTGLSICMISDDAYPALTGVGIHVQQVSRELVRRGHRVAVLTTRRVNEPAQAWWQGVRLHRFFSLGVYGFAQALPSRQAIRRVLQQEAAQVVHHHYLGWMMTQACAVAREMALPQISTHHFSAEDLTQTWAMRPFRPLIRHLALAYNNQCQLVIAPSQALVRLLPSQGLRTPLRYISNPLAFANQADDVPAARAPGLVVMYAGRLAPEKNLGLLLRAFAGLLRLRPQAKLWLAGQGPERPALERLCRALQISESVDFLGFLDPGELARHYAACDVFVLPSVIEAQPLVVMEAMWFAKPVLVTSAIVAAEEMVTPAENGYIVDPQDPADLADRLQLLAADPALRQKLGQEGHRRAQAYRPERVVDELEQAYREVICRG